MEETWLIAGLGNPGRKYEMTRHNIGFVVVNELAHRHRIKLNKTKHKGLYGECRIFGKRLISVMPQTYMNDSGECIREMLKWYKIPLEKLLVIYDDIDIAAGTLRIRERGSAGTHNGMRSIIYNLNDDNFPRIRIGIGRPDNSEYDLKDYVLGKFSINERPLMLRAVMSAADAAEKIIRDGVQPAMNSFNSAGNIGRKEL